MIVSAKAKAIVGATALFSCFVVLGALALGIWSPLGNASEDSRTVFETIGSESSPGLTDGFDILGERKTHVESLPSELADAWEDVVSDSTDQMISTGTLATEGGRTVTVIGNDQAVCLTNQHPKFGGATTCATPQEATQGQLTLVAVCEPGFVPGTVRVLGLVPNGAERISFESITGTVESVKPLSNVYEARLPAKDVDVLSHESKSRAQIATLPLKSMALQDGETCNPKPNPVISE